MRSMKAGVLLTVVACGIGPVAAADDEKTFARLEGTYSSSILGGCSFNLDRKGVFVVTCAHAALSDKAIASGHTIGIHLPGSHMPPTQPVVLPQPRTDAGRDSWPPSLEDPTVPLLMEQAQDEGRVWLTPIQWGPRLYLVRDLAAFCKTIARGAEPRTVATGTEFLRTGDHQKRVPRQAPSECQRQP